jgi:hypothetical protein
MKGNVLKLFLVLFVASFLFLGARVAQAMEAPPTDPVDESFWQYDTEVKFLAVNGTSSESDLVNFILTNAVYPDKAQYRIDPNGSWITLKFSQQISVPNNTIVYLQLNDGDNNGTLQFIGDADYSFDAYTNLNIFWGGGIPEEEDPGQITIAFSTNGAAAPVPLPATVWLLGAGVMAIVGIRRKNVA